MGAKQQAAEVDSLSPPNVPLERLDTPKPTKVRYTKSQQLVEWINQKPDVRTKLTAKELIEQSGLKMSEQVARKARNLVKTTNS